MIPIGPTTSPKPIVATISAAIAAPMPVSRRAAARAVRLYWRRRRAEPSPDRPSQRATVASSFAIASSTLSGRFAISAL